VFVPSERPPGRRAFTCAHELAHWRFDHGQRVDHLDFEKDDSDIPEERLANQFAAYLLMPSRAVAAAFTERNLDPRRASGPDIYKVACQFGVGYETLLYHLCFSERLLTQEQLQVLRRISPKSIRSALLGRPSESHLIWADSFWKRIPIDLEVGDHAIVPRGTAVRGNSVVFRGESSFGQIVEAIKPGLGQVLCGDNWAHMVRVSRKGFVGRGAFRHLEDDDIEADDNTAYNS